LGVGVAVGTGVLLGKGVMLAVGDGGTNVADGIVVAVLVGVGVNVDVFVAVLVGTIVGVTVASGVLVGVSEGVGVKVGVSEGKITRVGKTPTSWAVPLHAANDKRMMRLMMTRNCAIVHLIKFNYYILICIIPTFIIACQPQPIANLGDLPTRVVLPSESPIPTSAPSLTPTLPITSSPTITNTATITPTLMNTETPTNTVTPTEIASITPIIIATLPPTPAPNLIASQLPDVFGYGQSVEGRTLTAHKIGSGSQVIMLVGGIHGGFEANTITLVEQFILHFNNNPLDVLPNITLILVPSANPDGATYGRSLRGRFNANGVDLNRNWDCDWSAEAFFRDAPVFAGNSAFSEPESVALAALINDLRPAVVLFYHSAADGIYAGDCAGGGVSAPMAEILGNATGYSYGVEFTDYVVNGTASSWVDSLGIASADVELASADLTEFSRNLEGVLALQCWLTGIC